MSTTLQPDLLQWDLDTFYSGFDAPGFIADFAALEAGIQRLNQTLDGGLLEPVLRQLNEFLELYVRLYTYTSCRVTTDTTDEVALANESRLDIVGSGFSKFMSRYNAWVGTLDLDAEIEASEFVKMHEFPLRRAQVRASHLMSPAEEDLAAEMRLSGLVGWAKLHGAMTSQLEISVELPDGTKTLPMSALRNLAMDANREVRRRAYDAELKAWKTVEVPLAACMNGVKGEVNTLCKRRGWGEGGLNEANFANHIDRETLDAMMSAAKNVFPAFRRYLIAKAILIGAEKCEFFDLFAPVEGSSEWSIERGSDFVAEQFDQYSQKMGDFARKTYAERWIDWQPRKGKVGGAYCAPFNHGVSRVLMNYDGSFNNVSTLAHELGHAYHNLCMENLPLTLAETPSTLAETASIFCETIVKNAALKTVTGDEKLALLEACIQGPCQTVVDISSRFLFEQSTFEGRANGDLSPSELCAKMLEAQKATYGEGLASYHPYMWAAKPHYYDAGSFYNYPYMFGLLFALGLYAKYLEDPESFKDRYDDLLASTGMADAYTLGRRFGFDTRDQEFWAGSLSVIEAQIDQFVALVEARG